ncbi:MAG: class I SAM-dependent methyltransferase [Deltaproteobacteria bacterium]|nr:MAG: class I SAM-dependent methyltransferase [Deltaproteobacteria bacterium]
MSAHARRLALGQWFTPPAVADLALALAGARPGMRLLDPACGEGVFLARAAALGITDLHGIEIDPDAAGAARGLAPGARVECGDLFDVPAGGGDYDVVVGNPPYVRQERLSAAPKRRVRARLAADWPDLSPRDLDRLVGRGDLASACVARALRLARPGGRVALVLSSALVDAGYADALWRLVARHGRVLAIVDAPRERWFADAAVNAVVVVLQRGPGPFLTRLARLRVPTADAAVDLDRLDRVADVRSGGDPAQWAALLRAPDAWFAFRDAAGDRLVRLGDVAQVRRGITSGANDVFYLTRADAAAAGVERDLWLPLVKRPGDRIAIDPDATERVAIACPPDALDRYPGARRYFAARADAATRPTLRARSPWWALPARPARVFLTKAYHERFVQHLAPRPVVADQRVYALTPRPGVGVEALAAVLNSTYTALALESLGRASMGEGALEWTVADAASLPIVDPRRVGRAAVAALGALAARPVGPVAAEIDRADRAHLDEAVAPGLPRAALLADLVAAVARRTGRARAAGVDR